MPTEHDNAACFLALILGVVQRGNLPEAERNALARTLADRAMIQLTIAVDQGYRNTGLLRKNTDLDPLRPRLDFQALVERSEAENPGLPAAEGR